MMCFIYYISPMPVREREQSEEQTLIAACVWQCRVIRRVNMVDVVRRRISVSARLDIRAATAS